VGRRSRATRRAFDRIGAKRSLKKEGGQVRGPDECLEERSKEESLIKYLTSTFSKGAIDCVSSEKGVRKALRWKINQGGHQADA